MDDADTHSETASIGSALCQAYSDIVDQNHARGDQWLSTYSHFPTTTFHQHQVFNSLAIHYGYELIDIPAEQYDAADPQLKSALRQIQTSLQGILQSNSDTVSSSALFDIFADGQDGLGALCVEAGLPHPQSVRTSGSDTVQGTRTGAEGPNRHTVCATHKLAVDFEDSIAQQLFPNVPRDKVFGWMTISAIQGDDFELALSNMVFDVELEGPDTDFAFVIRQLYASIRSLTEGGGVIETARESGMWAAATMDILRVSSICKESGLPYPDAHRRAV